MVQSRDCMTSAHSFSGAPRLMRNNGAVDELLSCPFVTPFLQVGQIFCTETLARFVQLQRKCRGK